MIYHHFQNSLVIDIAIMIDVSHNKKSPPVSVNSHFHNVCFPFFT